MDYYRILNLNSEPFSNSPDPDFFFQSVQHAECLQKLEISLRLRRGLNVVIGDVGAGKTTLSRLLIRKFTEDDNVDTYLILDPDFKTTTDFLTTVSEMIGAEKPDDIKDDLKLKESIKQQLYKKGVDENRTTVLILDEGQKIPLYCLEILREFLNYETNDFKLLQTVIFAQREFEEVIESLENFRDRMNFYYELGSLSYKETKGLVTYRLNQASQKSESRSFFSFTGFIAIYILTGGFPRKIINLCHRSLLAMIIQNRSKADWFLVASCADKEGSRRLYSKVVIPALCILVFILGSVFSAGIFQSRIKGFQNGIEKAEIIKNIKAEPPSQQQKTETLVKSLQTKPQIAVKKEKKIIDGIIEETIIDDSHENSNPSSRDMNTASEDRQSGSNGKKLFLSISELKRKETKSSQTQNGIKILSGPGASIQVRRLIPEKTDP